MLKALDIHHGWNLKFTHKHKGYAHLRQNNRLIRAGSRLLVWFLLVHPVKGLSKEKIR
jgi:hypothetical protein